MENVKRCAFMDSNGEVVEISMCDPAFAPRWCELNGFILWTQADSDNDRSVSTARLGDRLTGTVDELEKEILQIFPRSVVKTSKGDELESRGLEKVNELVEVRP